MTRNKTKTCRKTADSCIIDMEKAKAKRRGRRSEEEAPKNRGRKSTGITLLVILVLTIALGCAVAFRLISLHGETKKVHEELKALEREKASLEEELERVNEPEYIEQKARDELQMIMPDETLYVIEDKKEAKKGSNSEDR
ncbi:MAG: FtsB family cell division protein [Anaerovoracaceae bacterium]|jgi:cell division protein DivIC